MQRSNYYSSSNPVERLAAEQSMIEPPDGVPSKDIFSPAIEDNSFFIEEAYNQEPGVVQHISTGLYFRKPVESFEYSFTQKWPVVIQDHQLSVTIPYSFVNEGNPAGFGDLMINYRYQLTSREDFAVMAPRISLIVPSGKMDHNLGMGRAGIQFNLPMSKRLSEQFVGHVNAGFTWHPDVEGTGAAGAKVKRTLMQYHVGGSMIWLPTYRFNMMLEFLQNSLAEIDGSGNIQRSSESIISPGFRAAFDVGDLQIVPGVAVPMIVAGGQTHAGVFLYLSLEHPF